MLADVPTSLARWRQLYTLQSFIGAHGWAAITFDPEGLVTEIARNDGSTFTRQQTFSEVLRLDVRLYSIHEHRQLHAIHGSWPTMDAVCSLLIPDDVRAAFAARPRPSDIAYDDLSAAIAALPYSFHEAWGEIVNAELRAFVTIARSLCPAGYHIRERSVAVVGHIPDVEAVGPDGRAHHVAEIVSAWGSVDPWLRSALQLSTERLQFDTDGIVVPHLRVHPAAW